MIVRAKLKAPDQIPPEFKCCAKWMDYPGIQDIIFTIDPSKAERTTCSCKYCKAQFKGTSVPITPPFMFDGIIRNFAILELLDLDEGI